MFKPLLSKKTVLIHEQPQSLQTLVRTYGVPSPSVLVSRAAPGVTGMSLGISGSLFEPEPGIRPPGPPWSSHQHVQSLKISPSSGLE